MVVKAVQELNSKFSSQSIAFETMRQQVASLSLTVDSLLHPTIASGSLDPLAVLQTTSHTGFTLATLFNFILDQFSKIGINFGHDGNLAVQQVDTQRFCVDGTCIGKDEFKTLLQNSGVTPSVSPTPTPSPTATPEATPSDTPTPSVSPTPTPSDSPSPTPSDTPVPSDTPTPTDTPTPSPTATP
jgi:outer membrane biosynthesis protein TonB